MVVHPLRPPREPDDVDDFNDLFEDVKAASSHELEMAVAAVRRPALPFRSVHPIAEAIPAIDADVYRVLKADIAKHGQKRAVAMYQGMIFDGSARYDVCTALGLVPRVRILRSRDPGLWLLDQNLRRCGAPRSPERMKIVDALQMLRTRQWRDEAAARQAAWIAEARQRFQQEIRPGRWPQPCTVCGLAKEYSHAHHVLPLNIQYEIGIDEALHDFDWVCPVHHKAVHRLISGEIFGSDGRYRVANPDEFQKLFPIYQRGLELFRAAGGVTPRGNWGMF